MVCNSNGQKFHGRMEVLKNDEDRFAFIAFSTLLDPWNNPLAHSILFVLIHTIDTLLTSEEITMGLIVPF